MKKNYFFLILFSILSFNSFSQTHTWTGDGNDFNWFNTSNWDTNAVPSNNQLAIIPENFYVEIIDDFAYASVIQIRSNSTLSIENNLTVNQAIFTSQETNIVWKKGVFKGGMIINGDLNIESFEAKEFDNGFIGNYGTIKILNSSTINFLNEVNIFNSIDGIISIESSGGFVEVDGNTIIENEGLIEMPSNEMNRNYYMILDINNMGTINVGENQAFLFLVNSQNLNNMETGRLEGKGVFDITSNFTNLGTFSPAGNSVIGTLEVINNFSFPVESNLEIDIHGTAEDEYDTIAITGFPNLNGTIYVNLEYAPLIDDEFIVITANDIVSCNLPEYLTAEFEGEEFYFEVICDNTSVKLRVVEEVLDIEEITSEGYKFYVQPNPVKEDFKVILNPDFSAGKNISVELYNYFGQKVKSQNMTSSEIKLQKGNLTSGLYLLLLKEGNSIIAKKKLIFE